MPYSNIENRIVSFFFLTSIIFCMVTFPILCSGCRSGGGGGGGPEVAPTKIEVANVLTCSSLSSDIVFDTPKARLSDALATSGYGQPGYVPAVHGVPPARYSIVIGESDDTYLRSLYADYGIVHPVLPVDGYHMEVIALDDEELNCIVVSGKGPRGVVYAIYELIRLVNLNTGPLWETGAITQTPAFPVRYTSFYAPPNEPPVDSALMHPDEILRMGYNGIILYGLTSLCTYEDYDPRFYDPAYYQDLINYMGWPDLRDTVHTDRAFIRNLLERAKEYHLEVFLDGDMFVLPTTAFLPSLNLFNDLLHDWVVFEELDDIVICPAQSKVYEIVEATIDEIFKLFPDLDGIQIRSGEVYPFKHTIVGSHPLKDNPDISDLCEICEHMSRNDRLRSVANEIRRVVVDKHGKRLNQRAWGYYNSWHSIPEDYLEVVSPIPVNNRLTFSLKQTRTDFWRYNSLNPSLGTGLHGQWAEFQCQREYEGKGAFPLYMGRYFAEGGLECIPMGLPVGGVQTLYDKGVIGGWGWCRGGGWNGPHVVREEWIEVNVYALGRLLWDPQLDPYELAREWLVLNRAAANSPVSDAVLDAFVEILRLSEDAMLKARYVKVYAENNYVGPSNGWTPCQNWMRDDELNEKVQRIADKLYETSEMQLGIQEKEELLDVAAQLMAQWDIIVAETVKDDTFWQDLYGTAQYGDSLYRVISHYFQAVYYYTLWAHGPTTELRQNALQQLDLWEAEWQHHTVDIPLLPGVASTFKDKGMVGLCEQMRTELDP